MMRHLPLSSSTRSIAAGLLLAFALLAFPASAQFEQEAMVEVNKGTMLRLPRPAKSVIVADPAIADIHLLSPSMVYISGKKVGETSIMAIDSRDNEILNTTVTVTHNLSKLSRLMREKMPQTRVQFDSVDGAIVMHGDAASPLQLEAVTRLATSFLKPQETLINMTRVAGSDQVMLRVRVVEVARTSLKRFGIHLESLLNTGNFIFGLASGRQVISTTAPFIGDFLRPTTNDRSIFGNYTSGNAEVNGVIDALEEEGLISVLAEPNLTAISGKTANFLAGGEIPIPVPGQDNQVTIEYKPFGVSLNFTPVVLSNDKISLTVAPEVSNLTQSNVVEIQGFTIPAIVTRRASTTVELGSGQTFAIAGLLQNDGTNNVSKFPGLGDVPVLGTLFRSTAYQNNQTELVILVTPYVVRPVSDASQIATPLDGYVPPSDLERILLGKLYHEQPAAETQPHLRGPVGYILK